MKRIIFTFLSVYSLVMFGSIGGLLLVSPAFAASPSQPLQIAADAKGDACAGIGLTGASCTGAGAQTQANTIVTTIINIFSAVVGVAAVIMVIIAGMKYTTSNSDASKIANAKTTLIYALVGLVVVAGAQTVVHFVLKNA